MVSKKIHESMLEFLMAIDNERSESFDRLKDDIKKLQNEQNHIKKRLNQVQRTAEGRAHSPDKINKEAIGNVNKPSEKDSIANVSAKYSKYKTQAYNLVRDIDRDVGASGENDLYIMLSNIVSGEEKNIPANYVEFEEDLQRLTKMWQEILRSVKNNGDMSIQARAFSDGIYEFPQLVHGTTVYEKFETPKGLKKEDRYGH